MFLRLERLLLCAAVLTTAILFAGCGAKQPAARAPERLADTGLYADIATRTLAAGVMTFAPQYPLWTDGAAKQRWIALPRGAAIDASDVDHWQFPIGTRLWKQFAWERAVETRFMELRTDGTWLYATYVWNEAGTDAVLAPDAGVRRAHATAEGRHHDIPSLADCRMCHESGRTAVLGFSALQLSPDRDPLAPHAAPHREHDVDLHSLAARGLLRGLPERWQHEAPRVAARSPVERAALGYLHGNCSSCHNADGPLLRLGLRLDHPLASAADAPPPALETTVGVASEFTRDEITRRIAAGDPAHSLLPLRIAATDSITQMPPLGRHLADRDAVALLTQWIRDDTQTPHPLCKNQPNRRKN